MGQSTSKPKDSLVLGCLAGRSSPCANGHSAGNSMTDCTLFCADPVLYNFTPIVSELDRSDQRSGRLISHASLDPSATDNNDLTRQADVVRDLEYVDQKYYSKECNPEDDKCDIKGEQKHVTWAEMCGEHLQNDLRLSSRNLQSLSNTIALAVTLEKLDISNNHLSSLPEAIGYLGRLRVLNVSHNHLTELPDTIGHLLQLTDLDLSHNRIHQMTPVVGHLSQLQKLYIGSNPLTSLPVEFAGLIGLVSLHVSPNPQLEALPAELLRLPNLQYIDHEHCPLLIRLDLSQSLRQPIPSLKELCVRAIVDDEKVKSPLLPPHLQHYLTQAKPCSACNRTYVESYISRLRLVDKADTMFLVEYRLCSLHWSSESDRLLYMFSNSTHPNVNARLFNHLPSLPSLDDKVKDALPHQRLGSLSGTSYNGSTTSYPAPSQEDDTSLQKLPGHWRSQRVKKVANRRQSNLFGFTSKLKQSQYGIFSSVSFLRRFEHNR